MSYTDLTSDGGMDPRNTQTPVLQERERINSLLAAIREHWVKANGEDSIPVAALDQIASVIADGSFVPKPALTPAEGIDIGKIVQNWARTKGALIHPDLRKKYLSE